MSFDATAAVDQDQDKIIINVGGKRHESYLSTLRNIPDTRLAWLAESIMNKQTEQPRKEIFFDRHPDLFAIILNYYRTGKLHAPRDCCGPLFEDELVFWGIEEMEMEACCWPNYAQHRDAEKNLKDFVGPEFEDEEDGEFDTSKEMENYYGTSQNMSLWQRIQPRVWAILDDAFSSRKAKIFAMFSLLMIILSILLMCASSLQEVKKSTTMKNATRYMEYIFCTWFTLELFIRILFCPEKLRFFKQVMTWIDIISLLPYYYKFIMEATNQGNVASQLDFLRSVRLIRLFRAFRFFRFTSGLQIIVQSLKASFRELLLLVIILLIPVVLFSSVIYDLEKDVKGNSVNFTSIPQSFWWAIITMTTVGYGDMSPKTLSGQIIGSLCAICGVLIIGLPVSVIGNNFSTYYEHAQARLNLPRKKRRLIMGDANRLAFLQGTSQSSTERDRDESITVPIPQDAVDEDDLEFQRNYRRYHRRSRNTMFARGDVYIGGQTTRNKVTLPTTRENSREEELEEQKGARTPESLDAAPEKLPRNFTLINSTHESEEIIEETVKPCGRNPLGLSMESVRDSRTSNRKSKRSNSSTSRSKSSIELKTLDPKRPLSPRSSSPRPRSSHSFRSRVQQCPEDSTGCPPRAKSKSPYLTPSLSATYLKAPDEMHSLARESKKRYSDQGLMFENSHAQHSKENGNSRTRERTMQNGTAS
ncbi:potassium voltage-gated channel subfamily C member 1 isoform X2 [Nematostella vectensis]|nr:potassium voltage-gated channel subfamily C member 1 isoform X2 [Nematostella vectensis]